MCGVEGKVIHHLLVGVHLLLNQSYGSRAHRTSLWKQIKLQEDLNRMRLILYGCAIHTKLE